MLKQLIENIKIGIRAYWPCLIAFALFFILSVPNSQKAGDDYVYSYICEPGVNIFSYDGSPKRQLTSVSEIIPSQVKHYYQCNSRFVVHCLVQLYIGVLGYGALTATKAIMSMLVFILLCKISTIGAQRCSPTMQLIVLMLMISLLPFYSIGSFFGTSALTFNYMLPTLGMLFVIYTYIKYHNRATSPLTSAFLAISALVCGSLHEGFSLPLTGALVIYTLCNFRQLSKTSYLILVGQTLGSCYILYTPSSYSRLSTYVHGIVEWISTVAIGTARLYYVFIPVALLALFVVIYNTRNHCWVRFRSNILHSLYLIYGLVIVFSIGVFIVSNPYFRYNARPLMPVCFALTLIAATFVFRHVKYLRLNGGKLPKLNATLAIVSVFIGGYLATNGMTRAQIQSMRLQQYIQSPHGYIVVEDHNESFPPAPFLGFDIEGELRPEFTPYESYFFHETLQEYYSGSQKLIKYIPDFKGGAIDDSNVIYHDGNLRVYTKPDSWWIVVRGYEDTAPDVKAIEYNYRFADLPSELLSRLFTRHPMEMIQYEAEIDGEKFLVVYKPYRYNIKRISLSDVASIAI